VVAVFPPGGPAMPGGFGAAPSLISGTWNATANFRAMRDSAVRAGIPPDTGRPPVGHESEE